MMRRLINQQDVRSAQSLNFCYDCGGSFAKELERKNVPDHIPPQAVIGIGDRDFPLKVACHEICNHSKSVTDKKSGQAIGAIRGEFPKARRDLAIKIGEFPSDDDSNPHAVLFDTNWHKEIWRWVRAFHASLYGEFLAEASVHRVFTPFPVGRMSGGRPAIDESGLCDQALLTTNIKHNLDEDCYDKIQCYNHKVRYICVWIQKPETFEWECQFALQVYQWKELGDRNFPRRGCVGRYIRVAGAPINASIGTTSLPAIFDGDPLDAFVL